MKVPAITDTSERFLISSKPYERQNTITVDQAMTKAWEIHYRFKPYDVFITVFRRSYIPPIMDMFQDIIISSMNLHIQSNSKVFDQVEMQKKKNKANEASL